MKEKKIIPITLITGYLGSGKTTLINYLLTNTSGYKMAVIVNDIGEVNIDASLIEKGGIVSGKDENLVALQNGCICCTLKKDLIEQIVSLLNDNRFDHILIEASGICEPVPIAQTLSFMEAQLKRANTPIMCKLDAILSVTDCLRLRDEFGCGEVLEVIERGEEDIENLVIQQIEFCDVVLLNKASEVSKEELERIKKVIKALQPMAKIVECDYCKVDLKELLDTNLFDYEKASSSAGWIQEFENRDNEVEEEDDDDEDDHHHHHHHHHHENGIGENDDEGTKEEYDIETYVYYRRRAFDKDRFDDWAETTDYGRMVIRTKGIIYFTEEVDDVYIYEQAGRQKTLTNTGKWFAASLTERQIKEYLKNDANFRRDWDEYYGDRLIKLVFIGQNLDKKQIKKDLDEI